MVQTKNSEIERIIQKYGQGFDTIYFDGKYDNKLEVAQNFLEKGVDIKLISECTGLSINEIKKLKRKL